jgi:cell division protein FtsB
MAKRAKETPPESGIVKVVDPLYDEPIAVEMPQTPPASSGLGARVRRFFELLLRLISWVIIFTVFGAALYYGVPLLYQRFVAPVEQNTFQMAELQSRQEQLETQLAELQERYSTLESEQGQSIESLTDMDERISQLESGIDSHTKSLAVLEKMQAELDAQNETISTELKHQIDQMKAVELLSRARLYMYQSNFGLAKQDVQIGRDLLIDLRQSAIGSPANNLDAVIRRLDLVLSNLPSFPVAASDDLDIAWQILVTGMPPVVDAAATAVPAGSLSATPAATITPTPQQTSQPTATP